AHSPTDYEDGTGAAGPYVHQLYDKDGNQIGQFSLDITAPSLGSTLVKIKSTGSSVNDSGVLRKIQEQVAKPSIAKYAFAGNENMRFGEGTEVYGPIHSNGGIRFDGLAHNVITSGATSYTDTDSDACTKYNAWGVHTCESPKDPAHPTAYSSHSDVFAAGREVGQPTIDFSGFTTDLATLKSDSQTDGFYRDTAGSNYVGYHVVLKTNDTFDLYKIKSWASYPSHCNAPGNGVPTYSVGSQTLQGNYAFPDNGIIFIQDNVVVDGQINGARLTIVAALLPVPSDPSNYKNVIVNNDLLYTNFDSTDAIGLIGQNNVYAGLISDDNLTVDAALIAQNGEVGRLHYTGSSCSYATQNTISLYGMIASYQRYGFAWTDGTGYVNRDITYDANLLYAPPPSFPLTSDQYQIISWQEVK
ncbi:MAG TPA: hypothetical protein VG694_01235, partial [Candidatus Paceibacterota bacterium]|nr:hypothetical protein [Candidatus Paceibacterota bacterium]